MSIGDPPVPAGDWWGTGRGERAERVPEHGPTVLLSRAWATNSSGLHLRIGYGVASQGAGKVR